MIAATRRYRACRYLNRLITATTRSKMLVQVNSLRFAGLRWLTCSPASRNSDPLHVTAGRGGLTSARRESRLRVLRQQILSAFVDWSSCLARHSVPLARNALG